MKIFSKRKRKKGLEILIQTIRIYSQDKGMDFAIVKCAMLIMKKERRETTEGIEISIQANSKTLL